MTWSGKTSFVRYRIRFIEKDLTTAPTLPPAHFQFCIQSSGAPTFLGTSTLGSQGGVNVYANHSAWALPSLSNSYNVGLLGNATGYMVGSWTRGIVRWISLRMTFEPSQAFQNTADGPNYLIYGGAVTTDVGMSSNYFSQMPLMPGFKVTRNRRTFDKGGLGIMTMRSLSVKKTIILSRYDSKFIQDPSIFSFVLNSDGVVSANSSQAVCYPTFGIARQDTTAFPANTNLGNFYFSFRAGVQLFRPRMVLQT